MAYVNGPQMIRDIMNRAEQLGARVWYSAGWENRGNGQSWPTGGPKGFVNHHTAGGNNIYLDQNLITGIPGLQGPLCNFALLYDGDIVAVSAYPANHAGASGGWDTAPLPHTGMFNREVLGVEIQYRGVVPMADIQYKNATILNQAAKEVLGWPDYGRIKFHQGTSIQGKWDPGYAEGKTYDIYKFRKDVAAVVASAGKDKEGPFMALSDSEQREIVTGSRQLSRAWPTRDGEKRVAEMIVALYDEFRYEYTSLFDERNPVKGKAPFKGSPVRYLLEMDAKLEQIRRDGERTAAAAEKAAAAAEKTEKAVAELVAEIKESK